MRADKLGSLYAVVVIGRGASGGVVRRLSNCRTDFLHDLTSFAYCRPTEKSACYWLKWLAEVGGQEQEVSEIHYPIGVRIAVVDRCVSFSVPR